MSSIAIYAKYPHKFGQRRVCWVYSLRNAIKKAFELEEEGYSQIEFKQLYGKYKWVDFDKIKNDSKYLKLK